MPKIHATRLPNGALLEQYSASGAYTDCYSATLVGHISLADFMGVFYTTPIFKLERWILAKVLQLPSTDQEAQLLAQGRITRFAAWSVEARQLAQTVLAAGRTRSWLMALPVGTGSGATAERKWGGLGKRLGGSGD